MSKKNLLVRGGADFSEIQKEFDKLQKQMNVFNKQMNNSMGAIGKAIKIGLGAISIRALGQFVKATTQAGSDVAEIQNVVDTTFGSMSKEIDTFSKNSIKNFGLGELAAKKYASYMGAMLKSSGIAGNKMKDMSMDLTKLTADMASFYNLDNDEMFQKLMSGMSGATMPLKQLGINMNIANLEAFALSEGINKSWKEMSQAEQTMLRYNYLLAVTGDQQGDFSRNAHNWAHQLKILKEGWTQLKATIGQGFINILAPIIRGFNILISRIQIAAEYFRAFTKLIFGDTQASKKTANDLGYIGSSLGDVQDGLGGASKGLDKTGKAGKKAAKDLKGAIAGFDEINQLTEKTANADSGVGGAGNSDIPGGGNIDFGNVEVGEVDLGFDKVEEDILSLKSKIEDFYNNWGMKDIFEGIRQGAELVDFSRIKENFKISFQGWSEIAESAFNGLQPIFQSGGEVLGTLFKYGIAIPGNYFEPISEGFANFTINMKEPIKSWVSTTSNTIKNGFTNLNDIFESLGSIWLASINKYKPQISSAVESTFNNITQTVGLIISFIADSFKIITGKLKDFVVKNEESISQFADNVHEMFLNMWNLVNQIWEDALEFLQSIWDDWGKETIGFLMDVVLTIGEWFLHLWNNLVSPIWNEMVSVLSSLWDSTFKEILSILSDIVGKIGKVISHLWNAIFKPLLDLLVTTLTPVFKVTFSAILQMTKTAVEGIGNVIKDLLKILDGIIEFLIGVFTGDWQRAWEGVSNIFGGIMDGLVGLFKTPFNIIISGINTFIRGINKIKMPDWVPGVGGFGFDVSEIPHLATGGIIDKPTLAVVGEAGKEAVMPLENNTGWIDKLAGQIATGIHSVSQFNDTSNNSNGDIVLEIDGTEFARIIKPSFNKETDRYGVPVIETI